MGSNLKLLRSPAGSEVLLHPRRPGPATESIKLEVAFARRRTLRPRGAGLRQLAAFSGERSPLPSTYRSRYSTHEPHLRVQLQERSANVCTAFGGSRGSATWRNARHLNRCGAAAYVRKLTKRDAEFNSIVVQTVKLARTQRHL
jgi:hypothetical protein